MVNDDSLPMISSKDLISDVLAKLIATRKVEEMASFAQICTTEVSNDTPSNENLKQADDAAKFIADPLYTQFAGFS